VFAQLRPNLIRIVSTESPQPQSEPVDREPAAPTGDCRPSAAGRHCTRGSSSSSSDIPAMKPPLSISELLFV